MVDPVFSKYLYLPKYRDDARKKSQILPIVLTSNCPLVHLKWLIGSKSYGQNNKDRINAMQNRLFSPNKLYNGTK